MCLCCVLDNYFSFNFPTQPYLVLFLFLVFLLVFFNFSDFPWNSYTCTTVGSKIVLERLVTSSNLFCYNLGTLPIGHKIRNHSDFITVVSSHEKIKPHKVCILWSLLIVWIIPYEKMFMVIKMHKCIKIQNSQYQLNDIKVRWLEWWQIRYKISRCYRIWLCYGETFSIKVCKWNQRVK